MFSSKSLPNQFRAAVRIALLLCLGAAAAQTLPPSSGLAGPVEPMGGADSSAIGVRVEIESIQIPASLAPSFGTEGLSNPATEGVAVSLWIGHGRADLGIGLGSVGPVARTGGALGLAPGGSTQLINFGLRYHLSSQTRLLADGYLLRGTGAAAGDAQFNRGVGVEWAAAKHSYGFESGAVSWRLDSGYRLALKTRKGGLMLQLRKKF